MAFSQNLIVAIMNVPREFAILGGNTIHLQKDLPISKKQYRDFA